MNKKIRAQVDKDIDERKNIWTDSKRLTVRYAIIYVLEKTQNETIYNKQGWTGHLLWDADKGRICNYCGINIDIPWLDVLKFFHQDCWKRYRKDHKLYPMPKYA
ncbi:MAG: hypothetical protein ACJ712_00925 [Nitrososphaeraceae archaeon]